MANIKSAKKDILTSRANAASNKIQKTKIKTATKNYEAALESGDATQIAKTYAEATSAIDKACTKGTINKACANRKKSRLACKNNKK
ncbi:MAG: 30S ribosomal protein S20 [Clostridia bacterium]|nr:30S ribosomal protein S20 [Clostridia bacterium]